MQKAIYGPHALPDRTPSLASVPVGLASRPAFSDVLHHTFSVFTRFPVPVLTCALVCFGMPALIGSVVYAALNISILINNGNFFAATPGIYNLQLLVQAVVGSIAFLFGRGAIVWMAQHAHTKTTQPISLRAALRATAAQWRALLVSTLLYGALITVAEAGLTVLLRELRLDVSNFRWIRNDANSVLNVALVRSLSNLPPDPGSPFTELRAATGYQLSRQGNVYYAWGNFRSMASNLKPHVIAMGMMGLIGLVVIETLLCMRNAVIMQSRHRNAAGWLRETMALGLRHFWRVTAWRWGTRLVVAVLIAFFLILPLALHQSVVVTAFIREVRAYWPWALTAALHGIATALVGMVVFAFHAIFEAQLHAALTANKNRMTE